MRKYSFTVCLIFFFAVLVRFVGLSIFPAGLNQDEASIGYEAYSLLQSGADRNGNKYPIHFTAWGNGQNALYAYLSMPVIKLFGLSTFSVRFVNAFFSCISLLVFFLISKEVWNKRKSLFALAFFAICPWSVMSARWGLESNLLPSLFLLAIFFLIKGIERNPLYYIVAALFFGISLYAYGTAYLVVPLFLFLVFLYLLSKGINSYGIVILSTVVFLLLAVPIIIFVVVNCFNLDTIELLGFSIPKMVANRTVEVFNLFSSDFFYTLAKNVVRFLAMVFLQTDRLLHNSIPMFGMIYPISLPFFFYGVYVVFQKRLPTMVDVCFFLLLVCAVLLGITTYANINRVNIIIIPEVYFSLQGIFAVFDKLPETEKNSFRYFMTAFYGVSFLLFVGYYVTFFNEQNKKNFAFGLGEAVQFSENEFTTDTVNVTTHSINMPYIYVCFFAKTDPLLFRNTVQYSTGDENSGFRQVSSFGHYRFTSNALDCEGAAIVSEDEFSYLQDKVNARAYKKFGNYYVVYPKYNLNEKSIRKQDL